MTDNDRAANSAAIPAEDAANSRAARLSDEQIADVYRAYGFHVNTFGGPRSNNFIACARAILGRPAPEASNAAKEVTEPQVRAVFIAAGAWQDPYTAEWEMGDDELQTAVRAILAKAKGEQS